MRNVSLAETAMRARRSKNRQSASGPISVIMARRIRCSLLRQLLGDRHHLLNDDNWVVSGMSAFSDGSGQQVVRSASDLREGHSVPFTVFKFSNETGFTNILLFIKNF